MSSTPLRKGSRVVGAGRTDLISAVAARYANGEPIRAIAEDLGRSYGFVHGLLTEAGSTMRGRGGARQRRPREV